MPLYLHGVIRYSQTKSDLSSINIPNSILIPFTDQHHILIRPNPWAIIKKSGPPYWGWKKTCPLKIRDTPLPPPFLFSPSQPPIGPHSSLPVSICLDHLCLF